MHYWELREEAHKSWENGVLDELIYLPDGIPILNKTRGIASAKTYAEIYLEGHVWLESQFMLLGQRHANYMAIIESINAKIKRSLRYDSSARKRLQSKNVPAGDPRKLAVDLAPVGKNSAMFIEIAHGIETPERVCFVSIPSVVWLKRQDFTPREVRNSHSLLIESLSTVGAVAAHNGELSMPRIDHSAGMPSQAPDQLIEAGSHVVKQISDRERNIIGDIEKFNLCDIPSLFRIGVGRDRICFFSGERFEQFVESVQVRLRPTKLQVGIEQTGA